MKIIIKKETIGKYPNSQSIINPNILTNVCVQKAKVELFPKPFLPIQLNLRIRIIIQIRIKSYIRIKIRKKINLKIKFKILFKINRTLKSNFKPNPKIKDRCEPGTLTRGSDFQFLEPLATKNLSKWACTGSPVLSMKFIMKDVFQYTLQEEDKFMLMATDGIWAVLNNLEVNSYTVSFYY